MGEQEDKEKAEKLAAAKKRVAQLKKQKAKAGGTDKEKKTTKAEAAKDKTAPAFTEDGAATAATSEDAQTPADEKPVESTENVETPAEEPAKEEAKDTAEDEGAAPTEPDTDTIPEDSEAPNIRSGHKRQPSLSLQSKLRSSSFRRTSNGQAGAQSPLKSPTSDLPPMTPDTTDVYRKQAARLEELERDNKRLEKEAADGEARWRKNEEELEELREANGEATAFRDKAKKAGEAQKEIEKLKAELSSLQRQQKSHSTSSSKMVRSPSVGGPESSASPDPETKALLSSKDATITDMELEISNLRAQLSNQTSSCTAHGSQISALTTQLNTAEGKVRDLGNELADAKKSVNRLSEKAVKEGVEKESSNTKIRSLERDLASAKELSDEVTKKAETLEKKLEAMNKLHRESEARMQAKLVTAEKEARDLLTMKKKHASLENEVARLKDERERRRRKEAQGGGDDEGLDELEDEERQRLEKRIREIEAENFDLRRGVWRDRRKTLQEDGGDDGFDQQPTSTNGGTDTADDFTEVDLSGPRAPNRRASSLAQKPQHSTFTDVLSSGLAAFRSSQPPPSSQYPQMLEQDDDLLDDNDAFDERAFAHAQREEEMRIMVQHVREVKRKLKDWSGWRLDLVEGRKGMGGGMYQQGFGEIFEV